MATIEELERRINQLEKDLQEEKELTNATLSKANKAADYAQHAYRVDHYGIIWVWNTEQQKYCKTEMRVISPKVANRSIESRHIVDNAIEGRHLADNVIEGRMIKLKTIDGRSLKDDIIGPELIEDNSIHGDSYQAGALIPGKLADDAVQTRNIKDRNVTSDKLALALIKSEHLNPAVIRFITRDVQNQIDSIKVAGYAMSNEFGTDSHIGISQQKLTATVNAIYNLLEEALGRALRGFTWTVTPTYIYGEWPTSVHITAQPINQGELFEHIVLKVNGEVIDTVDEQIASYTFDIPLQVSANIHLDAQILGVPYYRESVVNHYDSFWFGSGSAYTDIMDEAHNINISEGSRLSKNITIADDEHIFFIIGEAWISSFFRADMNGVEIPFSEQTITIDGRNYKVLTSEDTYQAGTYNIDING